KCVRQRKYGVQISQLETDNPHIVAMSQAGHRVRIRKSLAKNITNQIGTPPSSDNSGHIVIKGETLTAIARQYNVSIHELVAINKDNLGEFLQIGQHLVIPGQQRTMESSAANLVHVVQRGETKYELSKKYNTSIETLERLNPQIVTMLKEGHILILPASSTETTRVDAVAETSELEAEERSESVVGIVEEPIVEEEVVEEEVVEEEVVEEEVVEEEVVEEEVEERIVEDEIIED